MAEVNTVDFLTYENIQDATAFYDSTFARGEHVIKLPDQNAYAVFSLGLCRDVLRRTDDFSSKLAPLFKGKRADDPEIVAIASQGWPMETVMGQSDPPRHTHNRGLVNKAFQKGRVDKITIRIRERVNALIDGFIADGHCDLMAQFAVPLPIEIVGGELGLSHLPLGKVKAWTEALADRYTGIIDRDREIECARLMVEAQQASLKEVLVRRAKRHDDLLQDIVDASGDDANPLTDSELISIIYLLMVGGFETTASAIGAGMIRMVANPGSIERSIADPSYLVGAVEEILRLESPATAVWRIAARDTEIGGVPIPEGSAVMVRLSAANRDPAVFEDPNAFCPMRSGLNRHVAFGSGIHTCVANQLARVEMKIAFEELFRRLKNIRLKDGFRPQYPHSVLLRGPHAVEIQFDAA